MKIWVWVLSQHREYTPEGTRWLRINGFVSTQSLHIAISISSRPARLSLRSPCVKIVALLQSHPDCSCYNLSGVPMQSPVSWLYVWPLWPGMCVLFLGVEALIITLIPPDKLQKWWVRVLALGLCFFLVLGELRAVKHEREETYEQRRHDMQDILSRFGGLHQDVVALQSNVAASKDARYLPTDSLKRRALDLSNEILRFLISREVPPEGFGQGGYGEG